MPIPKLAWSSTKRAIYTARLMGDGTHDLWFGIRDHSVACSPATRDLELRAPEGISTER